MVRAWYPAAVRSAADRLRYYAAHFDTVEVDSSFYGLPTAGTARFLSDHGVRTSHVFKLAEGRPHVIDHIKNGDIQLVINTSLGKRTTTDAYAIRRATLAYNIPYTTTVSGARAMAEAVEEPV